MFEALTRKLKHWAEDTPEPPKLDPHDQRAAMGILLVRVAMADRAYLFEEVAQIDLILAQAYGLKPLDAAKLRARCEELAFEMPERDDMARIIRDAVPYEARLTAARALWQVVLADGITDARETELVDLIEAQIGISAEDSAVARRAES